MAIEAVSQGRVTWRARRLPGLIRVKMPRGGEREVADVLSLLPGVRYAHEDFLGRLDQTTPPCGVVPNDTYFTQQWGLRNTGQTVNGIAGTSGSDTRAVEGWEALTDAPDVIIAVLDSGVNYTHADLAANIWTNPGEIPGNNLDDDSNGIVDDVHGAAFEELLPGSCDDNGATPRGDPWDSQSFAYPTKVSTEGGGHGTTVAAMAGAIGNNSTQLCGVAHSVKIIPIRIVGCSGALATSAAVAAVDYAIDCEARILNCSFGLTNSEALEAAFKSTSESDLDILVVTSSGNNGVDLDAAPPTASQYPALYSFTNIVVVAASDQSDGAHGNYGQNAVDLYAPGKNMRALDNSNFPNGTVYIDGTSFAAPMVAGGAALCYQAGLESTAENMVSRLISTARPVAAMSSLCVSSGVLDIHSLLDQPCY